MESKNSGDRFINLLSSDEDDDLVVSFRIDDSDKIKETLLENSSVPVATIKKTFTYYGFTVCKIKFN